MKESKFINKATVEYLKSKAGSTIQQQIQFLTAELSLINQTVAKDRELADRGFETAEQHVIALSKEIMNLQVITENYKTEIIEIVKLLNDRIKTALILAGIAVGGLAVTWLIRLFL